MESHVFLTVFILRLSLSLLFSRCADQIGERAATANDSHLEVVLSNGLRRLSHWGCKVPVPEFSHMAIAARNPSVRPFYRKLEDNHTLGAKAEQNDKSAHGTDFELSGYRWIQRNGRSDPNSNLLGSYRGVKIFISLSKTGSPATINWFKDENRRRWEAGI
jgi:hypothetical protein